MDFYTLEGAKELAKRRKKATCFWQPHGVSNMGVHKYIYDPSGTIKYYKSVTHAYATPLVFDGKGKRIM